MATIARPRPPWSSTPIRSTWNGAMRHPAAPQPREIGFEAEQAQAAQAGRTPQEAGNLIRNLETPKTGFDAYLEKQLGMAGGREISGSNRRGFAYTSGPYKGMTKAQAIERARADYGRMGDAERASFEGRAYGRDVMSQRDIAREGQHYAARGLMSQGPQGGPSPSPTPPSQTPEPQGVRRGQPGHNAVMLRPGERAAEQARQAANSPAAIVGAAEDAMQGKPVTRTDLPKTFEQPGSPAYVPDKPGPMTPEQLAKSPGKMPAPAQPPSQAPTPAAPAAPSPPQPAPRSLTPPSQELPPPAPENPSPAAPIPPAQPMPDSRRVMASASPSPQPVAAPAPAPQPLRGENFAREIGVSPRAVDAVVRTGEAARALPGQIAEGAMGAAEGIASAAVNTYEAMDRGFNRLDEGVANTAARATLGLAGAAQTGASAIKTAAEEEAERLKRAAGNASRAVASVPGAIAGKARAIGESWRKDFGG